LIVVAGLCLSCDQLITRNIEYRIPIEGTTSIDKSLELAKRLGSEQFQATLRSRIRDECPGINETLLTHLYLGWRKTVTQSLGAADKNEFVYLIVRVEFQREDGDMARRAADCAKKYLEDAVQRESVQGNAS
jgi:hypothetical protein